MAFDGATHKWVVGGKGSRADILDSACMYHMVTLAIGAT